MIFLRGFAQAAAASVQKQRTRNRRPWLMTASKYQLQRHLHAPGIAGGNQMPEPGVGLQSGWIEQRSGVHAVELGVVEGVVHLPAQLKPETFLDIEILVQAEVKIIDAGSTEH